MNNYLSADCMSENIDFKVTFIGSVPRPERVLYLCCFLPSASATEKELTAHLKCHYFSALVHHLNAVEQVSLSDAHVSAFTEMRDT